MCVPHLHCKAKCIRLLTTTRAVARYRTSGHISPGWEILFGKGPVEDQQPEFDAWDCSRTEIIDDFRATLPCHFHWFYHDTWGTHAKNKAFFISPWEITRAVARYRTSGHISPGWEILFGKGPVEDQQPEFDAWDCSRTEIIDDFRATLPCHFHWFYHDTWGTHAKNKAFFISPWEHCMFSTPCSSPSPRGTGARLLTVSTHEEHRKSK